MHETDMPPRVEEGQALCPRCFGPVGRFDHFCPHCCAPVTAHAATDPVGQIYTAGDAYHSAATRPPRGIVVLGMWLVFGPQVLTLILALAMVVVRIDCLRVPVAVGHANAVVWDFGGVLGTLLGLVAAAGLGILYALLLWKVTTSYFRFRRRRHLGLCLGCGYDLRGNRSGRCPECGQPLPDADELPGAGPQPTTSDGHPGARERS